jgi:pimeloyl-ACP methyl ester carboxylesterase
MKVWRRGLVTMATLGLALLLGACNLPGGATTKATPTAATSTGRFTHAACPFSLGAGYFVDGQTVRCGFLAVPEDRANPASHSIQLAVAIFKTPSHTPAPDPVIFLQGGPGGRIIQDLAQAIVGNQLDLQTQFGNHDLILVDQRGTGYSKPSLQCPEVVNLQYMTDVNVTPQQASDEQNQALATCHAHLVSQGINLSAYTTASDAADVADLIAALGYQQVDLYGVSYGTRLALEIMRAFPQRIRSVILDSTVPPQRHLLTAVPAATARVFNTLFAGCAADATCNARYPHLDTVFYSLVTTLNAHPVTFQTTDANTGNRYTVLFHGDDLVNVAFSAFYLTQAIAVLPQMIYQVRDGNYQRASQLYGILIFDNSVAWGMYFSVECAEDIGTLTASQVTTAAQAYPPALRPDQLIGLEGELPGCQAWNVAAAPASEASPVTSTIPTLVMESEYDPITPPANGDLVAQTLPNSYKFLFPGVGHGAMLFNACPTSVAIAFWSAPTQKPDGSCIATMGEPPFVG